MANSKLVRLIIAGPNKGKSMQCGGVEFTDGIAVVPSSMEDHMMYLEQCYQAFKEGDPRIKECDDAWAAHLESKKPQKAEKPKQ